MIKAVTYTILSSNPELLIEITLLLRAIQFSQ